MSKNLVASLIKKIISIVRIPKNIFIARNENEDLEKNVNSDFSCSVDMKLDKSYVEILKKSFVRVKISTQTLRGVCHIPSTL